MGKLKRILLGNSRVKYIYLACVIIIFFGSGITFGRYAYTEIKNFYYNTQKFYFNSDKLSDSGTIIEMTNWSGVGQYAITFNMNSYANNNLSSDVDIYYDISYNCSTNVNCDIVDDIESSMISKVTNVDSFTIIITVPTENILKDKDVVELNVEVTSTSPYKKTLKGTFRLIVGHYGLSYEIDDSKDSPYLEVRITNTLDYYTVNEAFGSYDIGTQLDINTYQSLTEEQKEKCSSAMIELTFDPKKVLLDMTSEEYRNASLVKTTVINNYEYINFITFSIDALSSKQVKFYKIDTSKDYSYPNISNNSVIDVKFK